MKRTWLVGAVLMSSTTVFAAGAGPSSVMRQIPALPETVSADTCTAADALLADAEQQATEDMMQMQQLAMAGMSAGGGAITDRQGRLIAQLMDPAVTLCEMNATLALAGEDVAASFQQEVLQIRAATTQEVHGKCPVIDMADYRDLACVQPIEQRGLQREKQVLQQYIVTANAALEQEINAYAQCAETRETLADEAQAAKLPAQYLSIAQGGRANGWQMIGQLAERYRHYCQTALRESDYLRERERQ